MKVCALKASIKSSSTNDEHARVTSEIRLTSGLHYSNTDFGP
jgi:hypothetical protein